MPPTILCAQDDRDLFQIHQQALVEQGFRVLGVHDGEQALTTARDEEPDLVLIDAMLPKRDGLSVLKAIRRASATMPVVLLCAGRISPAFRKRAEKWGDVALLSKPVPLDQLLGQVREFVGRNGSAVECAVEIPAKGSLRQTHLAGLIHALHAGSETGVLLLEYGKKKKAIALKDGYPIAVKSNLVTECLGNLLVSRGQLTMGHVDESIRRVKKGEGLQGEILVAMDVLDEEGVASALREQAEAKFFELFEWKGGRFVFQRGRRLKRGNTLSLDGSPADMVMRAVRGHVPLARVEGFLEQHAETFVAVADDSFSRFQCIDLNEGEQIMLEEIDGKRPLGDFSNASERMRRTLYALLMIKLIVLRGDASSSPGLYSRTKEKPGVASAPDDPALRKELTTLAQELREQNHYEVLGIPTTADDVAVKNAYEVQIQRVHPDRYRNSSGAVRQVADEIHRLVNDAYEALASVQGRVEYASTLKKGAVARRDRERGKRALAAETVFQRGEAALRARDYEGALVFFGSAMEQMPEEGEYYAHYGWCLHLCHPDNEVMLNEAIEHVQRGIKLDRDREKPCLYLGRLYKVMGRTAAAEKMFTRAIQIQSDCVEALRELRLLNMRRDRGKGLIGKLLRR